MSLHQLVDLVRADFAQKGKASDRLTVVILRFGQYAVGGKGRVVARVLHRIVDLVWVRIIVGAELPASASVGAGLRLPHWGRGVILHPKTVIGENAYIYHGVTIGLAKDGTPVLGDRVYVGAGAKILGPVRIGDGAKIGAGAVVLSDVPPGATAVGVPARIIQ